MLFNSYGFVFLFLPLTLAGLVVCRELERKLRSRKPERKLSGGEFERKLRSRKSGEKLPGGKSLEKVYLLAVSLIFYGWRRPEQLPVLLGSMAVNYSLGWQLGNSGILRRAEKDSSLEQSEKGSFLGQSEKSGFPRRPEKCGGRKLLLAAGIVFNLGILGVFKYADTGGFAPLGISFFTFTQIAFLMECYQGSLKEVKALSYGLYVSFFPKMMQGPIALPGEMLGQFDDGKRGADWEQIYRSLFLFVLGLFKKVLLADTLGKAADFGYANLAALNSGDGLIVALSYTLQLYFDFSGYCDMAMGIAGMMGFELPLNFNSPYKASNILEFWKRWHITLTGFFTKYLYIPLGGSRKGRARTYLNCLIVFFLSGVWHGAGWQFIVWGLMHGGLFVLTRAWEDVRKKKTENQLVHAVSVFLTFLYVNLAWIFFRAPSLGEAAALIKTIGCFSFGKINWGLASCFNLDEFWYVIKLLRLDSWQHAHYLLTALFLLAALLLVFFGENAVSFVKKVKPGAASVVFLTVLFVWSVISFSGVSSFLYVNF